MKPCRLERGLSHDRERRRVKKTRLSSFLRILYATVMQKKGREDGMEERMEKVGCRVNRL